MKKEYIRTAICTLLALILCACAGCSGGEGGIIDINAPQYTDAASGTAQQDGTPAVDESTAPDATPFVQSDNVDPSNTIDPSTLDGTDEVKEEQKLSYSEYKALNSDVVGWIKISNTNVDYPVVKSHDNLDYLTQNAKRETSKAGAIFMDYRCSTGDQHIIIYGHNMSKSKIMFAQVTNYSNRSFYDANRTFELTLGDKTYTYKVFAVYSVDVNDAGYMAVDSDIPSGAAFADYMNNTLAALSIFPVDTTIGENDNVVTLSTCTHTNYANGRFVVHAVRVG